MFLSALTIFMNSKDLVVELACWEEAWNLGELLLFFESLKSIQHFQKSTGLW